MHCQTRIGIGGQRWRRWLRGNLRKGLVARLGATSEKRHVTCAGHGNRLVIGALRLRSIERTVRGIALQIQAGQSQLHAGRKRQTRAEADVEHGGGSGADAV